MLLNFFEENLLSIWRDISVAKVNIVQTSTTEYNK